MLKYIKRISVECAYRLRLKTGGEKKKNETELQKNHTRGLCVLPDQRLLAGV